MYHAVRHRTYLLLEEGAGGDTSRLVDIFLMCLIVANVTAVIISTVDPIYTSFSHLFLLFQELSIAIFSVEYLGRVWTAIEHPQYSHPIWGRFRFVISAFMVIDLLAILPFFIGVFVDLRSLRALRLFRFLRLFKLSRYSKAMTLFIRVLREKREDLIISSIAGGILLIVSSSLMYFIEAPAPTEAFSSIPATMWWAVVTLTTVGYGTVTPVTPLGKVLGGVIAIIGVGLFALPASILASGFMDVAEGEPQICPHCGEKIENCT